MPPKAARRSLDPTSDLLNPSGSVMENPASILWAFQLKRENKLLLDRIKELEATDAIREGKYKVVQSEARTAYGLSTKLEEVVRRVDALEGEVGSVGELTKRLDESEALVRGLQQREKQKEKEHGTELAKLQGRVEMLEGRCMAAGLQATELVNREQGIERRLQRLEQAVRWENTAVTTNVQETMVDGGRGLPSKKGNVNMLAAHGFPTPYPGIKNDSTNGQSQSRSHLADTMDITQPLLQTASQANETTSPFTPLPEIPDSQVTTELDPSEDYRSFRAAWPSALRTPGPAQLAALRSDNSLSRRVQKGTTSLRRISASSPTRRVGFNRPQPLQHTTRTLASIAKKITVAPQPIVRTTRTTRSQAKNQTQTQDAPRAGPQVGDGENQALITIPSPVRMRPPAPSMRTRPPIPPSAQPKPVEPRTPIASNTKTKRSFLFASSPVSSETGMRLHATGQVSLSDCLNPRKRPAEDKEPNTAQMPPLPVNKVVQGPVTVQQKQVSHGAPKRKRRVIEQEWTMEEILAV